jgi:hypothetical protein
MTTKINPESAKILTKGKTLRPEAEQILERLSIQKDSPPTPKQKEALLLTCKLLDSAVSLDEAIKQALTNIKKDDGTEYVSAEGGAIAKTNRTQMTVVPVELAAIPLDSDVAKNWDAVASQGASKDAQQLAGAPYDGIIEGSNIVSNEAEALKQHGYNLYMNSFSKVMNDPGFVKQVEEKYLGKFPPHWNLQKSD